MTDRPIIFSAPMVRALLAGRKTQTRRVAKFVSAADDGWQCKGNGGGCWGVSEEDVPLIAPDYAPYAVGDRLYVRENSIIASPGWTDSPVNPMGPYHQEVAYLADDRCGYTRAAAKDYGLRIRPSIHMPRWASRLTLTVTDVRVERLQAISEADAIAEGLEWMVPGIWSVARQLPICGDDPRDVFRDLWTHINGDGAWEANPWVVALTFDVHQRNIDQ